MCVLCVLVSLHVSARAARVLLATAESILRRHPSQARSTPWSGVFHVNCGIKILFLKNYFPWTTGRSKLHDPMFICFVSIPACIRQTDGRTNGRRNGRRPYSYDALCIVMLCCASKMKHVTIPRVGFRLRPRQSPKVGQAGLQNVRFSAECYYVTFGCCHGNCICRL